MKKINLCGLLLIGGSLLYMSACKKSKSDAGENNDASPRAATSTSPLPSTSPIASLPFPAVMAYVETNNGNLNNMGCYVTSTGKQVVNIANIFAGNINKNQETTPMAGVSLNPQAYYLLDRTTYVKDLKAKGIKVTMTLLNNHDGSGWSQFKTQAEADYFAKSVKATVDKYGLDGIQIDDEYAGATGNDKSIPMAVSAIRKLMPNLIIGYYIYSDSGIDAEAMLGKIADQITFAVTDYPNDPANYVKYFKKTGNGGTSDKSDRYRIYKGDHSGRGTIQSSLNTVTSGSYGGVMLFDATNYSVSDYGKVAKALYGKTVTVADPKQASNGGCLRSGGDKIAGKTDANMMYVLPNGTVVEKK